MKSNQFQLRKQHYELDVQKAKGCKKVCWKLSPEQLDFVSNRYGVEPALYEIRTQRFYSIKALPHLLKDIHYAWKRGKYKVVRSLSTEQEELLKEYGVKYKPIKYWIYLS